MSFIFLLLIYGRTRCYFRGKSVAIDLEKASYAMGEYYKINGVFPEELKEKVDIKQIEEDYKDYANIIIAKINYKSLKVDEVEFTPKFIKFFESFSEDVEIILERKDDIHSVYQRWSIMQEILRKRYRIEWKTPKEMNPNVMFD